METSELPPTESPLSGFGQPSDGRVSNAPAHAGRHSDVPDDDVPDRDLSDKVWRDKARADLAWREVLERIAEHALSEVTVTRLLATLPFEAPRDAVLMHARVREAMALDGMNARLPVRRCDPLEEPLGALRRGAAASGKQLRNLANTLDVALGLRAHALTHHKVCPGLQRDLEVSTTLKELAASLTSAISESGELNDQASEALRHVRRERERAREAMRQEQADLLRKYKDHLAGSYFAEREGRCVLPVKTDAPRVAGSVLGSSASGATLYVEPAELLEKNNRLRIAEAKVVQEETRVLNELSALCSARLSEIEAAYEACLLADRVAACATWAGRHAATPVHLEETPRLLLRRMRHPLLLPRVRDDAPRREVVANDFELLPGQALIISGPNAGGKTVALKSLGLAAWLAKSGLPVPCSPESEIGWLVDVFTDIGDDQSITRSLSTFTAHVTNLAHCLTAARPGVLMLLDEVAGGTDPDEGAALAIALLEALTQAGASIATTTHYERLKQLGAREGSCFRNASAGFDFEQMRPTFRITMGVPGASSALAVAERYGVPPAVIAAARSALPKQNRDQQRLIEQLESELERAEVARRTSESLATETQRRKEAFEREREHVLRSDKLALEKMSAELTKEVQNARSELRRAKALLGVGTRDSFREAELLVSQAALPITLDGNLTRAISAASSAPQTSPATDARGKQTLVAGMNVRLLNLGAEAVVVEAPAKGQVRVSIGGLKMSVPLEQVQVSSTKRPTAGKPAANLKAKSAPRPTASENVAGEAFRTEHNTCDLRGQRVDDGLILVDQFLDEMLRMREPTAFFLHGHGTGAMKAAVREHLADSRCVRHFEAASRENGGDAFTVAWLG